MKLYVGNLSYETSENGLKDAFGKFGTVVNASVIKDRDSGRSKGFGFVEMEKDEDGNKAIQAMNDAELDGRNLKVNVARPPEKRENRGHGGYDSRERNFNRR